LKMLSISFVIFRNRTLLQCILVMLFVFLFFWFVIKKSNS
jgi:hypothetical protein